MENIVIRHNITPDNLCRSLLDYRLRVTFCAQITAYNNGKREESYSHLYRLCYFLKGTATCFVNKKTYCIPNKTLLYLPPNHTIQIQSSKDQDPAQLYVLSFEIGNLARRSEFNQMMKDSLPDLMVSDENDLLYKLFIRIGKEAEEEKSGACGMIQNLFHVLLLEMLRLCEDEEKRVLVCPSRTNTTTSFLNHATEYIADHIGENLKISKIAEELGISEIYLYKLFKQHTGKSPQQFLADYRIEMAKEFLANPDYSIKMIADEMGFCCPNHFSSAFKKKTGLSPNAWRKQLKNTEHFQNDDSISCKDADS